MPAKDFASSDSRLGWASSNDFKKGNSTTGIDRAGTRFIESCRSSQARMDLAIVINNGIKKGCQSLLGPGDQGGHSGTLGHLDDRARPGLGCHVSDAGGAFRTGLPSWNGEWPLGETIGAGALTVLLCFAVVSACAVTQLARAVVINNALVKVHRDCCRCGFWISPGAAERTMGQVRDQVAWCLLFFGKEWPYRSVRHQPAGGVGGDQPGPFAGPGQARIEQARIPVARLGDQQHHLLVLAALGLVDR